MSAKHASIKEKHTELQTTLTTSEELLQTLLTGLSSRKEGQNGGGYMGQLAEARSRIAQAETEAEQSRVKLGMNEKELKALQAKWKEVEREAGDGRRQLDAMQAEVAKFKKKVADSGWNSEKEQEVENALREARLEVRRLTEVNIHPHNNIGYILTTSQERDMVKQRLSFLNFDYATPSPHFDRSKVKGLVASLIALEPNNYNKSTALEITAGGRLYNVVVENESVGKELIQNGRLKKRVTIIPLNKINASRMPQQVRFNTP